MSEPMVRRSKLHLVQLLALTAAMFGFGFALVPLYEMMCEAFGLNGKVALEAVSAEAAAMTVDTSRTVKVEFTTTVNGGRNWKFHSEMPSVSAASAMTVPGGKIASAPARVSSSWSCGGTTPPTTIMMSSRPSSRRAALSSGTSARCAAASEETPRMCTSFSTACRAASAGSGRIGAHSAVV